jgi:alkyl hydroperoxide reductase subunit AhpC
MNATFPMVGDTDLAISRKYGIVLPVVKHLKRVTFVIDAEGIVRGVFHHEVLISKHVESVRSLLQTLKKSTQS